MKKTNKPSKYKYKFKRHMSIGAMDAYEDEKFLSKCFVDTGDIEYLLDTNDSKCIVVGRTGSGKSALLEQIKEIEENVIILQPDELAINYIANSNIIRFFEKIGIKLDIFYQLLWRHVLAVELIKKKFNITNENNRNSFLDRIRDIFDRDKSKEEAINYLMEWGDKFWLEADKRIKELTTKLENELSASSDFSGLGIPLTVKGTEHLSSEVKEEIIQRAQNVVNNVQIQKLNRVIRLLSDDIFTDQQQKYYILIDRLDDDWVEDQLRYRLIRALIETTKSFRKIQPVKAIVSLRSDLLSIVFEKTRDSGFQEEKYDDLILKLKWDKEALKELLDKRISLLMQEQYTSSVVKFDTIFNSKPSGKKPIDYILDRTLMRPRDAISFINLCIELAYEKDEISTDVIKKAEKIYSKKRLGALCHEWFASYPHLDMYVDLIKNKNNGFTSSAINKVDIEELALSLSVSDDLGYDPIKSLAEKMFETNAPTKTKFKNSILRILYFIGVIGVKKSTYSAVSWSQIDEPVISEKEILNATHFDVHPMLHSVLGINGNNKKQQQR